MAAAEFLGSFLAHLVDWMALLVGACCGIACSRWRYVPIGIAVHYLVLAATIYKFNQNIGLTVRPVAYEALAPASAVIVCAAYGLRAWFLKRTAANVDPAPPQQPPSD